MPAGKKGLALAVLFIILFGGGITGGYLFFSKRTSVKKEEPKAVSLPAHMDDSAYVRVYYPSEGRLVMEERRVKRASEISIAEETVEEFLKGPSNMGKSDVPPGVRLLGIYRGSERIIYVDLSDEFRRNFQGDALTEFLVLKGLYESIISNIAGADDVKVLVEGREIESIGGHVQALYPLKKTVTEEK